MSTYCKQILWYLSEFGGGGGGGGGGKLIFNPLLHRLFLDHDIIFYF